MAFSGLIGAGVADELQQLLAQKEISRQREAALQQQQRQQEFENTFRMRQLEGQEADRAAAIEERAQARRDRANAAGLEEMAVQRQLMDADEARRELSGRLARISEDPAIPEEVRTLLSIDPSALKRIGAEDLVTPERRAAAQAAEDERQLGLYRQKEEITEGRQMRVQAADAAQQMRLAQMRQAVDGKKSAAPVGSAYADERASRTVAAADDLIDEVGGFTTGLGGSLMSNIPGTAAKDFAAKLQTLKSNIAFGELTEMRAASKTGGALGAVSERELGLLESSLGALDQAQSPAQIKQQLQQIRDSVQRYQAAKSGAVGTPAAAGAQAPAMMPSHGAGEPGRPNAPVRVMRFDAKGNKVP